MLPPDGKRLSKEHSAADGLIDPGMDAPIHSFVRASCPTGQHGLGEWPSLAHAPGLVEWNQQSSSEPTSRRGSSSLWASSRWSRWWSSQDKNGEGGPSSA